MFTTWPVRNKMVVNSRAVLIDASFSSWPWSSLYISEKMPDKNGKLEKFKLPMFFRTFCSNARIFHFWFCINQVFGHQEKKMTNNLTKFGDQIKKWNSLTKLAPINKHIPNSLIPLQSQQFSRRSVGVYKAYDRGWGSKSRTTPDDNVKDRWGINMKQTVVNFPSSVKYLKTL